MILAHDIGTTGNKASLYSDAGDQVAATTVEYPTDFGPQGKAEQDAEQWWAAVTSATRALLEMSGEDAGSIECVSFSGQMMGAVLLDDAGRPLRPAIIWADTRAQTECDVLVERVGMERCYAITGHRLNPTYSLSKLMWVRNHEPEVWSQTRTVLLTKDYVAFRLTGRIATDPSDASSTNAYDQNAGGYGRRRRALRGPRGGHHLAGVRRVYLPGILFLGFTGGRQAIVRPADENHDLRPRHPQSLRADRHHASWRSVYGVGSGSARPGPRF